MLMYSVSGLDDLESKQHLKPILRVYQREEALVDEELGLVLQEMYLLEEQRDSGFPILLIVLVEDVVVGVQNREDQPVDSFHHGVDLSRVADDRFQFGPEDVVKVLKNVRHLVQAVANGGDVLGALEQSLLIEFPARPFPRFLDVLPALQVSLLPAFQHRAGFLCLLQNLSQGFSAFGDSIKLEQAFYLPRARIMMNRVSENV